MAKGISHHLCLYVGWGGREPFLQAVFVHASDGPEFYGITSTLKFVDDFVIIPGAILADRSDLFHLDQLGLV